MGGILLPWLNYVLSFRKLVIRKVESDLRDGVLLGNLIELLAHVALGINQEPKDRAAKIANLDRCLTALRSLDLVDDDYDLDFIYRKDTKDILLLLSHIVNRYREWKPPSSL